MLGLAIIVGISIAMFKFLAFDRDEDRRGWNLFFAIWGFGIVIFALVKVFVERY